MPGSIQSATKSFIKNADGGAIRETFTAGADLVAGNVVKISANGTVAVATANDASIGVVVTGGLTGEKVVVLITKYVATALCIASGGTIAAGAYVTFTGIDSTTGLPTAAATASTKEATAIVLRGGASGAEMVVGIIAGFKQLA